MKKLTIIIAGMMLIAGCAKDGEMGPQGPAGKDGSSNVKTKNYIITPGMWISGTNSKWYEFYESELSQNVLDKGAVILYMKVSGYWTFLPVTVFNGSTPVSFSGAYSLYTLEFDVLSSTTVTINQSMEFKAVIIPSTQRYAEINWSNYAEVKERLQLPD